MKLFAGLALTAIALGTLVPCAHSYPKQQLGESVQITNSNSNQCVEKAVKVLEKESESPEVSGLYIYATIQTAPFGGIKESFDIGVDCGPEGTKEAVIVVNSTSPYREFVEHRTADYLRAELAK
jgi:hypothetical protein